MREISRFIKISALFITPLMLVSAFPFFVLYRSGELTSISQVLSLRTSEKILFGKVYIPGAINFRREAFLQENPMVTALGNSRVLQIRKEFFRKDVTFFNTAVTPGHNIQSYRRFVEQLPKGHEPKVILIQLDQSFFVRDDSKINSDELYTNFFYRDSMEKPNYLLTGIQIYKDYFHHKFTLDDLSVHQNTVDTLGLNAQVHLDGYRNDGSYNYGKVLRDPENPTLEDYHFRNSFSAIQTGSGSFEHGNVLIKENVAELGRLVEAADRRGIHLVVYLPPYAPTVYAKMKELPQYYAYIDSLASIIRPFFANTQHSFSDFSDPIKNGFRDEWFIDGNHDSERLDAQILLTIATYDSTFAQYLDIQKLQNKLNITDSHRKYLFSTFVFR